MLETLLDIILTIIIGSFFGMVAAQFLEPRAIVLTCVLAGIIFCMTILAAYTTYKTIKEAKRERRKHNVKSFY